MSSRSEPTPAPVVFPNLSEVALGPKPRPTRAEDVESWDAEAQRMIDDWLDKGDDPEVEVYRLVAVAALRRDWLGVRLLSRLSEWGLDHRGQAFVRLMANYVEDLIGAENQHFAEDVLVKEIEIIDRDRDGKPLRIRETIHRELP